MSADRKEQATPPAEESNAAAPWWLELMGATMHSPILGHQRAVFTNRTLRLEKIRAVGFDLDHTLAIYRRQALDELAMRLVTERLLEEHSFDESFTSEVPDPSFARMGLIIDLEWGNVLKVDRFGHVKVAYHGATRLSDSERRDQYGKFSVLPHTERKRRFIQSDSSFSNPDVLLFAALVPQASKLGYQGLWETIRNHADAVHRDGTLKAKVTARPLDFISPDLATIGVLESFKAAGKKLFLLTNSEWEYACEIINPALGLPSGMRWLDLFDHVCVEADKPDFFKAKKPRKGRAHPDHPKVVRGGNIEFLEQQLDATGPEILYVGDHIYADLITSKRQHWRTMLVIPELEDELEVQATLPGVQRRLHEVDERRAEVDRVVQHWRTMDAALEHVPAAEQGRMVRDFQELTRQRRAQAEEALRTHIQEREQLRSRLAEVTNPYWGSLFRAGSELTYYGNQLESFACTYTGRVSNLALYPVDHYFRSPMDHLPHELDVRW